MLHFAILTYGLLLSFVFSSAARNSRDGRTHAPVLVYTGYILCGISGAVAVGLPVIAGLGMDLTAFA